MSSKRPLRAAIVLSLGFFTLLCTGCSPTTGKVSGTVTYKGKAVPGGIVTFVTEQGSSSTANIGADGNYAADKVPIGTAKVSVYVSSPPKMKMPGGGHIDEKKLKGSKDAKVSPEIEKAYNALKSGGAALHIPAKYGDANRSGLSVTVASGQNPPYNIDLKD